MHCVFQDRKLCCATADDSALSSSANVTVTVNQAPFVNAGIDQTVPFPNAATLTGVATDDGLPLGSSLATSWTQLNGPGQATFADPTRPAPRLRSTYPVSMFEIHRHGLSRRHQRRNGCDRESIARCQCRSQFHREFSGSRVLEWHGDGRRVALRRVAGGEVEQGQRAWLSDVHGRHKLDSLFEHFRALQPARSLRPAAHRQRFSSYRQRRCCNLTINQPRGSMPDQIKPSLFQRSHH